MNGVFYVASGEKYRKEAIKSLASLKKYNPNIHTTIFSDKNIGLDIFDRYINIPNPSFSFQDKILCFQKIDYEKTLFLDADTYITSDICDIFDLLERFDFAACIEVARGYWYDELDIPDCFPELNSGVIAFRQTPHVKELFSNWNLYHEESKIWQSKYLWQNGNAWDQPGLRRALYISKNIRFCVLPTEYNALRQNGTYLWGKAKIIHGRGNIEKVASRMNESVNVERVFFQGFGVITDFSRISVKRLFNTIIRVNLCGAIELFRRFRSQFK